MKLKRIACVILTSLIMTNLYCFADALVFPEDTGGWTLKSFKTKSLIIHDTQVLYEDGKYYASMTNDDTVYVSDDLKSWKRAGIRPTGWYSPEEHNYLTWAPCYIKLRQPYTAPNGEAYEYALFDALSYWGSQDSRIRCFVMHEPAPDSKAEYYYVGDVMSSGKYALKEVPNPRKSYEDEETGAEGAKYYFVEGYERQRSAGVSNAWNAIDPDVLYGEDGKLYLVWGSWFGGIFVTELDQNTLMPLSNRADSYTRIAYMYADECIEGATVFYHEGYYYLCVAYGDICYSYNTRIARSESITGPYLDYNGASMTGANGMIGTRAAAPYAFENDKGWRGQGHCDWVYNPDTDEYFLLMNGRTVDDEYARQMVRSVWWLDGWPVLAPEIAAADTARTVLDDAGNAVKSSAKAPGRQNVAQELIAGEYEIVVFRRDMNQHVNEEVLEKSRRITLADDGSVSGAYSGSWHMDEEGIVNITLDGVKLRAIASPVYDWERERAGIIALSGLTEKGAYSDPMAGTAVWLKGTEVVANVVSE
ncbi:MAG: glycoside hydrolase family 43 protein [Clostridia bacterium]|nr:glycoside hydrolase family 43 protein [Clostridia bacterium]